MQMVILDAEIHPGSPGVVPLVLSRIGSLDLDGFFTHFKKRKIGSWPELVELSSQWKSGSYDIHGRESAEYGVVDEIGISLIGGSLKLMLALEWLPERQGVLAALEALLVSLHEELCERALLGPTLCIRVAGLSYPRPRPPRSQLTWTLGTLVDFACERFHLHHARGRIEDVEKLVTADLPAGATLEKRGDLWIWRWLNGAPTTDNLREAASLQEQFFSRVLDLPIDDSFNELGDKMATLSAGAPAQPLTMYDPSGERGYKAVVPKGGRILEEIADEISACMKQGALADGAPVKRLTIMVPTHEDALAVAGHARELGADEILYADATRSGIWWNPFPPGEWL